MPRNCSTISCGVPRAICRNGGGSAFSTVRITRKCSSPASIRRSLHSEGLPGPLPDQDTIWQHRYRSINDLEWHLHHNGTRIIKFFLHLSKEEQRKRFLQRIDEPEKNWKFSLADIEEREFWKDYRKAYEACLTATSTRHAPWYVVPADDKENTRLIVSEIILDTIRGLKMSYPETSPERRQELLTIRQRLTG